MDLSMDQLKERAKCLEKKAKKLLRSPILFSGAKYNEAGETYCELYNVYCTLGLNNEACMAVEAAVDCFTKERDWLRAALVSEESVKTLMIKGVPSNISRRLRETVELYMKAEKIDAALELLHKTAKTVAKYDNQLATEIIKLAIHIAEVEQRPKQAEIYKSVLDTSFSQSSKSLSSNFDITSLEIRNYNFIDNPTSGAIKNRRNKKDIKKNVASALDSTILPLSAAVYSGVGGYASVRPGWIGLTPGQFREIRKMDEDKESEQEMLITSSLV